jgi:hypothetical protein
MEPTTDFLGNPIKYGQETKKPKGTVKDFERRNEKYKAKHEVRKE